jgi:predicted N-acetyltransferase YhbS
MTAKATNSLEIVPATRADLPTILSILSEAQEWLSLRGMTQQWQAGDFQEARLTRAIDAGEVYLAKLDGEVVATASLTWQNTLLWADVGGEAAYLNRVAVRRAHAGKKIGQKLVEWAEQQARAKGRKCLRLDCAPSLSDYYAKLGFNRVGHRNIGERTAILFEKTL